MGYLKEDRRGYYNGCTPSDGPANGIPKLNYFLRTVISHEKNGNIMWKQNGNVPNPAKEGGRGVSKKTNSVFSFEDFPNQLKSGTVPFFNFNLISKKQNPEADSHSIGLNCGAI